MRTVLTVREAQELFGAWPVRQRIRDGLWSRPCRGVVVTHNGPLDQRERDLLALTSSPARSRTIPPWHGPSAWSRSTTSSSG